MESGQHGNVKGIDWVPWIRWEDNTIQCVPAGLENIDQVKEYADKKSAENGMGYLIL